MPHSKRVFFIEFSLGEESLRETPYKVIKQLCLEYEPERQKAFDMSGREHHIVPVAFVGTGLSNTDLRALEDILIEVIIQMIGKKPDHAVLFEVASSPKPLFSLQGQSMIVLRQSTAKLHENSELSGAFRAAGVHLM